MERYQWLFNTAERVDRLQDSDESDLSSKMKQIYNDSVANGVVFSAQDTGMIPTHHITVESLILSICDEDI